MSNEVRELRQLKDDIKVIASNKLSMSQSKLLLMGFTYEVILRKDLFPRNEDLKGFIDNVFVKRFDDSQPFRGYLYKSRTLLASRVLRRIYTDLDYTQITRIVNELYNVFPSSIEKEPKQRINIKGTDLELSEWMNFIRNRENVK